MTSNNLKVFFELLWNGCRLLYYHLVVVYILHRLRSGEEPHCNDESAAACFEAVCKTLVHGEKLAKRSSIACFSVFVLKRTRNRLKHYLDETALLAASEELVDCLDEFEVKKGYEHLFVDA